jgi:sugar phosphate isomerase/epimerase
MAISTTLSFMNNRREFLFAAAAFPSLLSGRMAPQLFKAGTCLGGRQEEAFWKNCDHAAEAGFHNIESSGAGIRLAELYDSRSQQLKEQFQKRNLGLVGYAQYSPLCDRAALKQLVDQHLTIARVLQPVGTRYITQLLTPPSKPGVPEEKLAAAMTKEETKSFAADLNEIAKALRTGTEFRIGFHAEGPEVAAGLIDVVMEGTDPRYVDLVADVGWIAVGGLDPLEVCRKYRSRIIVLHLRDWDPNAEFDRNGKHVKGRFVPLGQGRIDLPALISFLRDTKFSGYVNAEGGDLAANLNYMVKDLSIRV